MTVTDVLLLGWTLVALALIASHAGANAIGDHDRHCWMAARADKEASESTDIAEIRSLTALGAKHRAEAIWSCEAK